MKISAVLSFFVVACASMGCAAAADGPSQSAQVSADTAQATRAVQYFRGTVVFSELDGTNARPPFASLVRRVVEPSRDRVLEEVTEGGTTYVTIMKRQNGLVFSSQDTAASFHGTLTYADETLNAWSYDIQVDKPVAGHLAGALPGDGGHVDAAAGTMTVRKILSVDPAHQVLVSESYQAISEIEYEDALAALVP